MMFLFRDDASTDGFAFIGMDEAGYGPNLGPLVLTTTRWTTPSAPAQTNFYDLLKHAVHQKSHQQHSCLHMADSKEVYTGKRGLASLEASALSVLNCLGMPCENFRQLWEELTAEPYPADIPWFKDVELDLPVAVDQKTLSQLTTQLQFALEQSGLAIQAVSSQIITAKRFNELVERDGSKGITLSRLAFSLLRQVWNPEELVDILFVGDKHGGRNRYDELLSEVLDGHMIFRVEEGRAQSCYRVGQTELRFQTNGEQHFPVAVASIVSKYVRELSMNLFNAYWNQHCPEVKPTRGYPQDAIRFRLDVREALATLNIEDHIFWRSR